MTGASIVCSGRSGTCIDRRRGFDTIGATRGSKSVTGFVELDQVSLKYNEDIDSLALYKTNISVARGEFVAVVGPSGCGKSTLMKVVTGLWPATAGHINGQLHGPGFLASVRVDTNGNRQSVTISSSDQDIRLVNIAVSRGSK